MLWEKSSYLPSFLSWRKYVEASGYTVVKYVKALCSFSESKTYKSGVLEKLGECQNAAEMLNKIKLCEKSWFW